MRNKKDFIIEKIITTIEIINFKIFFLINGDEGISTTLRFLSSFKYCNPLLSVVSFTSKFLVIK